MGNAPMLVQIIGEKRFREVEPVAIGVNGVL